MMKSPDTPIHIPSDPWKGEIDDHGRPVGTWKALNGEGTLVGTMEFVNGRPHGVETSLYPNGNTASEMEWSSGMPHGAVKAWHENGSDASHGQFLHGEQHGKWTNWYPDGAINWQEHYHFGTPHGELAGWMPDGQRLFQQNFTWGVLSDRGFCWPYVLGKGPPSLLWSVALGGLLAFAFSRNAFAVSILATLAMTIFAHELGHFVAARSVGIPIRQFRVGIGPRIVSFFWRGALWEWHLIPVVGYVVPYELRPGELNNYSTGGSSEIDHEEERIPASHLVSRPRQLAFLLGGIVVNFVLAIVLLIAAGASPERALEKTTRSIIRIWETAPRALTSLVDPELYTSDRKGLLRSLEGAHAQGGSILHIAAILNIVVVAFNLLPLPGLDGFKSLMTIAGAVLRRDLSFSSVGPIRWLTAAFVIFLVVSGVYLLGRDVLFMLWK